MIKIKKDETSKNLGHSNLRRNSAAKSNYRASEIKRLLKEGVSLSKAAKMLKINYSLAKTLSTL